MIIRRVSCIFCRGSEISWRATLQV